LGEPLLFFTKNQGRAIQGSAIASNLRNYVATVLLRSLSYPFRNYRLFYQKNHFLTTNKDQHKKNINLHSSNFQI
jgi:hypothetical protein